MKISVVIWVKDEADVLALAVRQLLRGGVYSVNIMDDGSTDGTAQVIADLCAAHDQVHPIPRTQILSEALQLDGPVFGPVVARDGSDWLMVTDPDEFWLPRNGDLRQTRALENHDVVVVERFNAALPVGPVALDPLGTDAGLRDLPLLVARTPLSRQAMAEDPDLRWVTHRIGPKLMVRPETVQSYGLGMHQVATADESLLRRARGQDIVVAHLPFTTYARFERKVQNIAHVFDRYDDAHSGNIAWHWRRWLEIYRAGGLRAEFDRQFYTPEDLAAMTEAGSVRTAHGIFEDRRAEALARRAARAAAEAGGS
ncbi:glycosyltransferase family 2 protein [Dinoroseobacter sp. S124A]|uniref:glycosyltransferase family 2 protein n=1 Tax=Dinoroseobacter sp. S124A TaxID=3415128 RepID=UPI003C7D8460